MAADIKSISGNEFAQFAEHKEGIWTAIQGATVTHVSFGRGEIKSVKIRKNYIPQVTILFDGAKTETYTFNSDAFMSGKFTQVNIPESILELLDTWRNKFDKKINNVVYPINISHENTKEVDTKIFINSCNLEEKITRSWQESKPNLGLDLNEYFSMAEYWIRRMGRCYRRPRY